MVIAHCQRCGRIFNRVRRDICPDCAVQEDRAFSEVRAYLNRHPDADMEELVSETGVTQPLVTALIRDGRLILRDNPNLSYPCERCGRPTSVGRFCVACARELTAK